MLYIVIGVTFLFVFSLVNLMLFTLFYKDKAIEKLRYFDDDYILKEKLEKSKKETFRPIKFMSQIVPKINFNKKRINRLEEEIIKADIPITIEELLIIKILSSSAFAFLGYSISKNAVIVIGIYIFIWNLPSIFISNRKKERIKIFDSQLNEGVMIISNSLKAGYSFLQAVGVVTEETKDPFSKEFKKLLKEMSLGISEEDALKNLLSRMESEDLRIIMNAVLIQKDIGGNLSEILDNISETIRERQKIKEELKTLMAQGKLSGIIIMLIPFFLGAVIFLFNREYMLVLFTTPVGIGMVGTSVFNEILGLLMIKKIINVDL